MLLWLWLFVKLMVRNSLAGNQYFLSSYLFERVCFCLFLVCELALEFGFCVVVRMVEDGVGLKYWLTASLMS